MMFETNEQIMEKIPSVNSLPSVATTFLRNTANKAMQRGNSQDTSLRIAWGIVKSRFRQKENGEWVARAGSFDSVTYYTFKAEKAEEFVSRTEDGHVLHNYVLSDIWPDLKGTAPEPQVLDEWAAWINDAQPEVDTDHQLFETLKKEHGGNVTLVERAMKFKKGVAKAVKAFVDKGKLIVSLLFDKRYNNHIDKFKGLSVEAAVRRDELTNKWKSGSKLFGFTLAMNMDHLNPRAVKVLT